MRSRPRQGDRRAQGRSAEDLDHAIRQIVSRAVASDEVIDIFAAAGLKKPDISILSDEFLAEVASMPQRNLAVEMLRKLLQRRDQGPLARSNLVQSRSFAEMLETAIRALPEPGHRDRPGHRGADRPGQGDARGRPAAARSSASPRTKSPSTTPWRPTTAPSRFSATRPSRPSPGSWSRPCATTSPSTGPCSENVRAKMRVMVKRILRKYGYPPDKQEKATQTVLEQAEVLCATGRA